MEFAQKLDEIIKKRNISNYEMSKKTGLSDSLIGYWRKGERVPKADNLLNISNFLEVSTDYLLGRSEEQDICKNSISNRIINELTPNEQELLDNFNKLSNINKGKVIERAKILAEIEIEEKKNRKQNKKDIEQHTNPGYIESYTLPASAGTGVDLDACEKIILEVKDSNLISEANFAIRISGDSMEPEFHNGQYALVKTKPQIEQGKIGIFTVNSDGYTKKLGADELISLNPEYDNIPLHEYDNVRCRGEVIGTFEPEDIISKEEY